MKSEEILFLTVIAGRKQKDALLSALHEEGAQMIHLAYGRGTVKAGYLTNVLGLIPEEHKLMISCLLSRQKAESALDMLIEQFHFNKPNTGIAFTVPISRLTF